MALHEEFKNQGDFLFRHRSYLPLLVLAVGLVVFAHTEYNETETPETWLTEGFEFACLGISLLGLLIRVHTVGHTPRNTSGRNTKAGQVADQLNSTGLYSIVRHPLYLGNFFMWLGVMMLTESVWFCALFVTVYAVYYERIMYAEESFLRSTFGQTYVDWAQKVPAFVPAFRNYTKSTHPFSYKKVLKQEKNGLCAIFILFWLFDVLCAAVQSEPKAFEMGFWFYSAVVSAVVYLVLKVLKKLGLLEEDPSQLVD